MKIILASSSKYRRKLLNTIIPNIICIVPGIDEQIHKNESPQDYVSRLAFEKAKSISIENKDALIIGADQCGELEGKIITKPKSHNEAVKQLNAASNKIVNFYTGLCLYNSSNHNHQIVCDKFEVKFRKLSKQQIESYLLTDKPYDCAGSFKSEGLGIALFEKMKGNDPNTLIGLPLIQLVSMLKNENIDVLTQTQQ